MIHAHATSETREKIEANIFNNPRPIRSQVGLAALLLRAGRGRRGARSRTTFLTPRLVTRSCWATQEVELGIERRVLGRLEFVRDRGGQSLGLFGLLYTLRTVLVVLGRFRSGARIRLRGLYVGYVVIGHHERCFRVGLSRPLTLACFIVQREL
ncbi:hypothetical protein B0H16DRAFT_1542495 [Mycena metata]|uniref:Uncharacterized protein n=1 Tax=Mycena metata TaxID=1033252 RepID=A0AAD7J0H0_9AGAR|nr:hypothetical protein B0H16DRAFT_1542495 [Mycena metata]